MARLLRYLSLFIASAFMAAVFLFVSPSNADPGTAASSGSAPGIGETVTNLVNGVLDLLGLRGSYGTPTQPPTVSEAEAGCPTTRFSTASGDCPSGTQAFSTGGVAVPAATEAVPAAQAATPARLAFTGPSTTTWLAALAGLLVLSGAALTQAARPIRVSRAVG